MRYLKGRRPSAAMVVAVAALVVALTGGAYAAAKLNGKNLVNNSVASSKIKNGTLKTKDFSNKAVRELRGKRGKRGPAGPQGEQGPQGEPGETGPVGPRGPDGGSKIGVVGFEREGFLAGDIDGQSGWIQTGEFDSGIVRTADYAAASGYEFGDQAFRISNAVTSNGFGNQTYSPGLPDEAGEPDAYNGGYGSGDRQSHFEASFEIGTTETAQQDGLSVSVSPDAGNGSRVTYLRFEDQADGVHVIFADVDEPLAGETAYQFPETDVATLSRGDSHSIKFSIDFVAGPDNDVVEIYVDGAKVHTGGTWEEYYRHDPEQAGSDNLVPTADKLLFRVNGSAVPATQDGGYLIDGVLLRSSDGG